MWGISFGGVIDKLKFFIYPFQVKSFRQISRSSRNHRIEKLGENIGLTKLETHEAIGFSSSDLQIPRDSISNCFANCCFFVVMFVVMVFVAVITALVGLSPASPTTTFTTTPTTLTSVTTTTTTSTSTYTPGTRYGAITPEDFIQEID